MDNSLIVSIASTVTTGVLAIVALLFGYRQNVGWRPIIFAHREILRGRGGEREQSLCITVEFWNRRKYPVVVRRWEAKLNGVELGRGGYGYKMPTVRDNTIYHWVETVVNPQHRAEFTIEARFSGQSLDAMQPEFSLRFSYFDPYLRRTCPVTAFHRFFHSELGWGKTEVEREEARQAFADLHECQRQPIGTK